MKETFFRLQYTREGVYHDPSYMYPRDDYLADCVVLCKKFWGVVDKSLCSEKTFQRDWIRYANRCCRDRGTCHISSVCLRPLLPDYLHIAFVEMSSPPCQPHPFDNLPEFARSPNFCTLHYDSYSPRACLSYCQPTIFFIPRTLHLYSRCYIGIIARARR